MASLAFLWSNRIRYPVRTSSFFRTWAKRLLSLPELLQLNWRRSKFTRLGASIHHTAEIGLLRADGHKSFLSVGPYSFIGRVYMALHAPVKVGERVCINDGVEILTASHDIADPGWGLIKSEVVIEDYAWIGTGALILPGVHIGRGAVVGARSVVSKSVEPGAIVVGNPAKAIQKKRCERLNYNPCEFLAANRAWLLG
ncbi:maltose O-acetyltransferase [Pontibacter mucosus]|uniref:Maltose O-acetyltransferase n=2 Tax=Pontibacter mucosus TaxID=1649266 RepID=A0A2T5YQ94_9BACT|nr:maltose O-acetyltransferase [Pontibacter mucosus]